MRYLFLALLLIPFYELSAHVWIVQHVPTLADYKQASDFIRADLRADDLITAAPAFIDPILRWQLGDRMPLAMAGRSDNARYARMWVLSIRGALPKDAPATGADLARDFGDVQVLLYRLPQRERVLFDFVQSWSEADARIERAGAAQACPLRSNGVPRGGGLGKGVLMPIAKRFECDARVPWLFIGSVVLEGLENEPHHCIWQHPQGVDPVTLTFADVPLGSELRFQGGIYYEHERMRQGAPIDVSISIDGQERAQFRHVDGDGFRSIRVPTGAAADSRGTVSIAVRSSEPRARSFCWSADTRTSEGTP